MRPDALRDKWDALPLDVRAKVDPLILAELWGEIVPAHLSDDPEQALAALGGYKPLDKTLFIVHLKARVDMDAVPLAPSTTEEQRRQAVFDALVSTAWVTQEPVKQALDARAATGDVAGYQPFYIFNGLAVEGSLDTVIELAKREDVERIVANYPLAPLWGDGDATATLLSSGATHATLQSFSTKAELSRFKYWTPGQRPAAVPPQVSRIIPKLQV